MVCYNKTQPRKPMGATTEKHFNSQVKELGQFALDITDTSIKNEKMFFNSDMEYAYENGGAITKSFLDNLPEDWKSSKFVFDSRVHMLMPNWYPAIPGFHHDDIPRTGKTGQPNYDSPEYYSEHILGLVGAEICPTHFAIGECVMPKVEEGETIYKVWHKEVENLLNAGKLTLQTAKDRQLYYFDWQTFHTGTKCIKNGWRWFGRISRNTDRLKRITNEIRVNAQVYLEFPTEGW